MFQNWTALHENKHLLKSRKALYFTRMCAKCHIFYAFPSLHSYNLSIMLDLV